MHKTILLALLLVGWHSAGAESPQETQALMNAALRLKQAAVLRTLEDCKAKGGSVQSCNTLLELTHQRELKIIERLNLAPTDPAVNMDEMSKELAACSNPHYGYVETVECWSQLSDRLDAARKGQSLLTSAGSATGAASITAQSARLNPPALVPQAGGVVNVPKLTLEDLQNGVTPVPVVPQTPQLSPEDAWRHCMNDLMSSDKKMEPDDPLPKETLEGICRDNLHLPWYSHTPYESRIKYLSPYMGVIIVGGALIIIVGAVWTLRRWLANAAVTTAKSMDRSVFALTGFGVARWWSGVVRRWRIP